MVRWEDSSGSQMRPKEEAMTHCGTHIYTTLRGMACTPLKDQDAKAPGPLPEWQGQTASAVLHVTEPSLSARLAVPSCHQADVPLPGMKEGGFPTNMEDTPSVCRAGLC